MKVEVEQMHLMSTRLQFLGSAFVAQFFCHAISPLLTMTIRFVRSKCMTYGAVWQVAQSELGGGECSPEENDGRDGEMHVCGRVNASLRDTYR